MDRIESVKNPRVKAARALRTVKGRDESGMFLCEGEHMVEEAVRAAGRTGDVGTAFQLGSAFAVDTLFVDEAQAERFADLLEEANADHAFLVPAQVMEAISTVKSPQGIAAVVRLQVPQIAQRKDLGVWGVSPAAFGIGPQDPAEATDYLFDKLVTTVFPEEAVLPSIGGDTGQPMGEIPPVTVKGAVPPSIGGDTGQPMGEIPPVTVKGAVPQTTGGDTGQPMGGDSQVPLNDEAMDEEISPAVLGDRLVLLENVQDPGNVGTILRTMDAAGFSGAILTPGCADPYAPKALRATMGSIFRVPTMQVKSAATAAAMLKEEGYAVVAAAVNGKDFFSRQAMGDKICLIIGNEGAGITNETLAAATHRFRLPMRGGAESLNAAAAAAIFIYELAYRG